MLRHFKTFQSPHLRSRGAGLHSEAREQLGLAALTEDEFQAKKIGSAVVFLPIFSSASVGSDAGTALSSVPAATTGAVTAACADDRCQLEPRR